MIKLSTYSKTFSIPNLMYRSKTQVFIRYSVGIIVICVVLELFVLLKSL